MQRRILLLITDLQRGGTPTVVRELAVRLRGGGSGPHVEVACLSAWGPVADELLAAGVPVTALDATGPADLRALPRLRHLLHQRRFDTVFSFLVHANALAAAASFGTRGVRWIQSVQTTQPNPRWHWMVQRIVQHAAERIAVPSMAVAQAAHAWAGVPLEKIVVIPNAVDVADLAIASPVALAADPPVPYPITFLGRLDPVKDVPTLIDAMALLGPGVHLHVYGEGADRRRMEARIADRGVAGRVTLHGAVARPIDALRGSGLLVLPSTAEGFGLVLIEAMAAGVPVVASDIPGVRDVVTHGVSGLLVPAGDGAGFAAAIREVVGSATLRRRRVESGWAVVRERFTWEAILPVYEALLVPSPGSPGEG